MRCFKNLRDELDNEGKISIAAVTSKVQQSFDKEPLIKKFYGEFKTEHSHFLKFLQGVQDEAGRDWYASVMLNRLMFLYFIQQKRFLNGEVDYLQQKLEAIKASGRNYYRDFLLTMFFEGLACEKDERTDEVKKLLGDIPYLNGGLFLPHPIEGRYGAEIEIPNEAFTRLFRFFDSWDWHLDVREHREGNEINPDVLGYIFEKYINQKEMGAYYTQEDITEYICKNTILPFLLEKAGVDVQAVMSDVEPYIYDAVSQEEYLPTETEREYHERRRRYEQIKTDFTAGKIATINDLVTYNLDIIAFTQDWLNKLDDPSTVGYFYFDCLTKITVLDPTCGSGAFLFAAMNLLEPLYEFILDKMERFADPVRHLAFVDELKRMNSHSNRKYFVYKSIIVNNLYGVDIMPEAVEICKLRLFLKLVAEIDDVKRIEPLPDIDFNIRAGNTLVGFATQQEIHGCLFATDELKRKVADADRALTNLRNLQTRLGIKSQVFKKAKKDIEDQLAAVRKNLDESLMADYGQSDLQAFRESHQPFHWYLEFNHVLANGGFDVIIGNPPYVEYSSVRKYYTVKNFQTEKAGNLYAYVIERSEKMGRSTGNMGMIIPLSAFCTQRMEPLVKLLDQHYQANWVSHYGWRPSKLFDTVNRALSIFISSRNNGNFTLTTTYQKWASEARDYLIPTVSYVPVHKTPAPFIVPKFGQRIETAIATKLWAKKTSIRYLLSKKQTSHTLYYRNTGGLYWKIITDFQPEFYENGKRTKSSRETYLYFNNESDLAVTLGILNSNLFWWYYVVYSNCRDLNPYDIQSFPIGEVSEPYQQSIQKLTAKLMQDFKANCVYKERTHKGKSTVRYQEFHPRLSKPIIDQIDEVLADHYGFSDEEMDFIINYDIKYRVGTDDDNGDDED